jgi:hypothetical protein
MSKLGAFKAAEKRAEQPAAEPQRVWCLLVSRKGGGIVVEEGEVDRAHVHIGARQPAEALPIAASHAMEWIAARFGR